MKRMKNILLCLIIFGLMLMAISCGSNSEAETYPPDCERLSGLIGKEKTEVFTELGIQKDDVVYEQREYRLSKKVKYLGYSFYEVLQMDTSSEKEEMYGFAYRLVFENDEKKATKCTKTIMKKLEALYGPPGDEHVSEENRLSEKIEKTDFSGKPLGGQAEWKLPNGLALWFNVSSFSYTGDSLTQIFEIQYRTPYPFKESY